MRKILISIAAASAAVIGSANAATLTFKGNGADLPTSVTNNTPCSPLDICGTTLTYLGGLLDVTASAGGTAGQLVVQDLSPRNSGLGIYSEAGTGVYTSSIRGEDEINADEDEVLTLTFANEVILSDFELNNGTDQDCPDIGSEGGCGSIEIIVDGVSAGQFVAVDVLNITLTGTVFEFLAVDESYHLASLNVVATPLPAAALFMGTGLAAFARRRKQKA